MNEQMFWKKGEERNGEERRRSSSATRRWPRMDSISRRFSTDSGDRGGMDSASAPSSCDDVGGEKSTLPYSQQTLADHGKALIPGAGGGGGGDDGNDKSCLLYTSPSPRDS